MTLLKTFDFPDRTFETSIHGENNVKDDNSVDADKNSFIDVHTLNDQSISSESDVKTEMYFTAERVSEKTGKSSRKRLVLHHINLTSAEH